eukprot:1554250-Prymnesium_polylepis.1
MARPREFVSWPVREKVKCHVAVCRDVLATHSSCSTPTRSLAPRRLRAGGAKTRWAPGACVCTPARPPRRAERMAEREGAVSRKGSAQAAGRHALAAAEAFEARVHSAHGAGSTLAICRGASPRQQLQ